MEQKKRKKKRGRVGKRQSESFILVPRTSILLVSFSDVRWPKGSKFEEMIATAPQGMYILSLYVIDQWLFMIYATVVSVIYCINFKFKYFCRIMYIQERILLWLWVWLCFLFCSLMKITFPGEISCAGCDENHELFETHVVSWGITWF